MRKVLRFILLSLLAAAPAQAAIRSVDVAPPARNFGYFLGDILAATATIRTDPGTTLDPTTLPQPGPVSPDVNVQGVTWQSSDHGGSRITTITIKYQNFFGPENAPGQMIVPPLRLEFTDGGRRLPVQVPAWYFTVAPLRHDISPMIAASGMRPDHALPRLDASVPFWRMCLAAAVAALAALFLILRRTPVQAFFGQAAPFARAAMDLRRLVRQGDTQDTWRDGLLTLHRAFNLTAGRAVFAADLDRFLEEHPRFASYRPDIERLFALSAKVFFGSGSGDDNPGIVWLHALGRKLRQAEYA